MAGYDGMIYGLWWVMEFVAWVQMFKSSIPCRIMCWPGSGYHKGMGVPLKGIKYTTFLYEIWISMSVPERYLRYMCRTCELEPWFAL